MLTHKKMLVLAKFRTCFETIHIMSEFRLVSNRPSFPLRQSPSLLPLHAYIMSWPVMGLYPNYYV